MSSIWSKGAAQGVDSPFAANGTAPRPGGLRAAAAQARSGETTQAGLSPRGRAASQASNPMAASTTTGAGSGDTNADAAGGLITANDFLSLLVTEMQNQDPTADTDPNEYISQLVQINSLEQLISINQNLIEVLGTATSPVTPPSSVTGRHAAKAAALSSNAGAAAAGRTSASKASNTAGAGAVGTGAAGLASGKAGGVAGAFGGRGGGGGGNLSMPRASPASREVAHALDGRARGAGHGHGIRDIPTHP